MAIDADNLERRMLALLELEQSDESLDRVDDILIGVSATDMPQLIDAFTRRAWVDGRPATDRAGLIHDRLVDRGAAMAVARLL